jgi:hypothetical protein
VYWQGSLTSSYVSCFILYEYERMSLLLYIYKEKRERDSTHQNDREV